MRFVMYGDGEGGALGVLLGNEVVDLHALEAGLPGTMLELVDGGAETLQRVRKALDSIAPQGRPLSTVRLLSPLIPRGNVLCIGRNYAEHAQEMAKVLAGEVTRPTLFTKALTSVSGPYDDIVIDRALTQQVDWEAELGVVVGRAGKNIRREDALDHVFGYTVVNDVSARDVQYGWGGQFFKGKSLDTFCPIGPWIVTRDEVPYPQDLRVTLRVNGEDKQDASTRDMIFPVDELIVQLSVGMTLPAGTLIATGTPSGVGHARQPQEFLKDGDVVETEVEGIGTLRNRVREL